ncbi:MAG TPA: TrpB-like pyridoxal-phosphate dependent enzyme, partial [Spirochaetota bacterium]|nr:TrpB-like pyridoxal-phosphate dependent enzyme [Spirochaetota bacterium]
AVAAAIRKAKEAKEEGKEKVIIFNLSGHGLMDLYGYDLFLQGKLVDHELHQDEVNEALAELGNLPKPSMAKTGKW